MDPQASPATPQLVVRRVSLPDLLGALIRCATPANAALDAAFKKAVDAGASLNDAVRQVPHIEVVRDWVAANPDLAAPIVLCAIYLSSGNHVVQEEVAARPAVEPPPADSAAPAEVQQTG